jgi:Chitobiase/beta-hexosaminidase C-terminal domain
MKAIPLLILSAAVSAVGTDGAAQAVTSTVQLTQQSIQNTKSASEGQSAHVTRQGLPQGTPSAQSNAQTFADGHGPSVNCHCARQPSFSLNSSDVAPGTVITIASTEPDAVIYYTTDGWTPTNASPRYTEPITINATTRLQAIAIVPQKLPSPVLEADYLVNGVAPTSPADVLIDSGVLAKGTPLRLVTASKVTSETANVGDRIAILLDQNVVAEGKVVAHRGMSVEASIAWVERAGRGGKPGMVIFRVESIPIHGASVPLSGILTLSAPDIGAQTRHISNPGMVQVTGPLPPGNPAEIQPGMTLTAAVAADTPLHP